MGKWALIYSLVFSGADLLAATSFGVFRSSNNGTDWIEVDSGLTDIYVNSLVISNKGIFAGTNGGGIFLSTNNGTSWTSVSSGLTNPTVICLAVGSNALYAGTYGGIFLSTNDSSWAPIDSGLTNTIINSIIFDGSNTLAATKGGIFPLNQQWCKLDCGQFRVNQFYYLLSRC